MEETRHKMKAFERALSHLHEDNIGSHKAVALFWQYDWQLSMIGPGEL